MIQKWDYKTVMRQIGGGNTRFEIDGKSVAPPESFVNLFKELGQDGWELVAHSASILPPPIMAMPPAHRKTIPVVEDGSIHPIRQPTTAYWWVFKRPLE